MIYLQIFFGVWLETKKTPTTKNTGDEISLLASRIPATFTGFRLLLSNSSDEGWNPVTKARFWLNWEDSDQFHRNLG
jgi:hypothetical protein